MKMYIAEPVRRTCPPHPSYYLAIPLSSPPTNPCRREVAGESVRVTRRESKREEKRTGSGSIRRMSEGDRESEGDRGSGSVVEVRGGEENEEKTQERGCTGAREARGMGA